MTSSSQWMMGIKTIAAVVVVATVATLIGNLMNEEHDYVRSPQPNTDHFSHRNARPQVTNWPAAHYFFNEDGLAIFWRNWTPVPNVDPPAKAIIVLSHGLAEHSGRYEQLANVLKSHGYVVYALDHQGHGQSEGNRGYVKDFAHLPRDLLHLAKIAKREHPKLRKMFLIGHSMGGLISIHAVSMSPDTFDGVVLSAPPLAADIPPGVETIGPFIAKYFPKIPGPPIEGLDTLCRDPSVVDRYFNDPLVAMGSNKMRLLAGILEYMDRAHKVAQDFPIPYLLMHGTGDKMCLHRGSVAFHDATNVDDKKFVSFEGAYHELFNEPDASDKAIAETIQWLESRVNHNNH